MACVWMASVAKPGALPGALDVSDMRELLLGAKSRGLPRRPRRTAEATTRASQLKNCREGRAAMVLRATCAMVSAGDWP